MSLLVHSIGLRKAQGQPDLGAEEIDSISWCKEWLTHIIKKHGEQICCDHLCTHENSYFKGHLGGLNVIIHVIIHAAKAQHLVHRNPHEVVAMINISKTPTSQVLHYSSILPQWKQIIDSKVEGSLAITQWTPQCQTWELGFRGEKWQTRPRPLIFLPLREIPRSERDRRSSSRAHGTSPSTSSLTLFPPDHYPGSGCTHLQGGVSEEKNHKRQSVACGWRKRSLAQWWKGEVTGTHLAQNGSYRSCPITDMFGHTVLFKNVGLVANI